MVGPPLALSRAGLAPRVRSAGRASAAGGDLPRSIPLGGAGRSLGDAQRPQQPHHEHQPHEEARHGPERGEGEEEPRAGLAAAGLGAEVDGGVHQVAPGDDGRGDAEGEEQQLRLDGALGLRAAPRACALAGGGLGARALAGRLHAAHCVRRRPTSATGMGASLHEQFWSPARR